MIIKRGEIPGVSTKRKCLPLKCIHFLYRVAFLKMISLLTTLNLSLFATSEVMISLRHANKH